MISKAFIELAKSCDALQFGSFVLKSGRVSPYFFNAGAFRSGRSIAELGRLYAQNIIDNDIEFDCLFGPAYKGIPLVTTVAIALNDHHGRDVPYCFDRKEPKKHGEDGIIVGSPPAGKVLIVDDVLTAGTAVRQAVELLKTFPDTEISGLAIGLDRQERAPDSDISAIAAIKAEYGFSTYALAGLDDLITHQANPEHQAALDAYRKKYGDKGTP